MMLRIKIGASADRSLTTAWEPAVAGARRAASTIGGITAGLARSHATDTKRGADAAEKEYAKTARAAEKWQKQMVRDAEKSISDRSKLEQRAQAAQIRSMEKTARDSARFSAQASAAGKRAADQEQKTQQRESARTSAAISRGGQRYLGYAASAVRGGLAIGRDIAQGAGIDLDLSSNVSKVTSLEAKSTALANQGFMAGDLRNGQRTGSRELMTEALNIGTDTGTEAGDVLGGLEKFTAKTGDLATGRDLIKDMAILSKASGASLDDMADAAGDVSSVLGDIPNKGAAIKGVMQAIAGQGKLGAVEIRQMASQMAKLAANAGQIEGDTAQNVVLLGAFAQEARQRGGASTGTMAATSVAGLIDTFKTPARAAAFQKATGKKVFNEQGMIRNPQELLMEALRAKGMDPLGFKGIFANKSGARAVEGFATIYRQAGGGAAGEKAVSAEFERLKNATMAETEVMESFRIAMATTDSQAKAANNQLQLMTMQLQEQVTPALIALVPALGKTVDFLSWALGGNDVKTTEKANASKAKIDSSDKTVNEQLNQGMIVDEQYSQLQKNVKEAEQVAEQTKNAYQTAYESSAMAPLSSANWADKAAHTAAKVSDYGPGTMLQNLIFGKKGAGHLASDAVLGNQLDGKAAAASDARSRFEHAKETEAMVRNLISNNIISVKIVADTTQPPGAPPPIDVPRTGGVKE